MQLFFFSKFSNTKKKYGWCEKGSECSFSHNIDSIIEREENPTKKAKTDDSSDIKRPERKKYAHVQKNTHCAGFDSFICGYSFLSFLTSPLAQTQEDDWFGKISLPGFDVPLVLSPSTHYKNSKQFLELYNSEICQEQFFFSMNVILPFQTLSMPT